MAGRKFQIGNVYSYTVKKDFSYQCLWMTSNWLERNKILIRCVKVLNKQVDLGEPTSFLDHVYFGCTQRQCQISKDIVDNYRTMFESRISACGAEKLPFPQNLRISSWSYDMTGHAKKCVERYCELANKTTQQLYKVSTPCIDDHHFKEEETKSVGELSNTCSQIVLKCLYLARIGRPDILWSVNKLARSITKWTKACDKRLNRLISYIHHTSEYKQYCHVGNTAKQCRLGLFQDSDFAGDLEDSKSTSGGTLCIFGSHTFVPISWMCKKQTSVSHSSTESEIISLDTGLRLDGLLALELCKLPSELPMASVQKRRWESGARQFWAIAALQLETHLAYDGDWNRIPQPWDVIELFSTDVLVFLAVSSAGGRATQPYDGGLGNSLRTPASREELFEDVERWEPRLVVTYLPDWTPEVSDLALELVRKQRAERTGDSSQVSTPHLDSVAPWSCQGGTPSGLRNSGWSGGRNPLRDDSILVGDYDDSLGWSIE